MKLILIWLVLIFSINGLYAQKLKQVVLSFNCYFDEQDVIFKKPFLIGVDTFQIDNIKFYISDIVFKKRGVEVYKDHPGIYLVDISNRPKVSIVMDESIQFDEIIYNIGIDSLTSVSGAMGGDLDPTKGMYWTWRSGYINVKIEGRSTLCKTRNNEFQYHLGGYIYPENCLRRVSYKISTKSEIGFYLDIKKFFSDTGLGVVDQVMSPGPLSMKV